MSFPGLGLIRKEDTILGSRASTGCFPNAARLLSEEGINYLRIATRLAFGVPPKTFRSLAARPTAYRKAVSDRELD